MDNMGLLVKFATILSFLTAPFYAILNYTLITGKHTPKEHQPNIFENFESCWNSFFSRIQYFGFYQVFKTFLCIFAFQIQ